jgi:hypothetical protein
MARSSFKVRDEISSHNLQSVQAQTVRRRASQGVSVATLAMCFSISSRMQRNTIRCRWSVSCFPAKSSKPPCNRIGCSRKRLERCVCPITDWDFVIPMTGQRVGERLRRLLRNVGSDLLQDGSGVHSVRRTLSRAAQHVRGVSATQSRQIRRSQEWLDNRRPKKEGTHESDPRFLDRLPLSCLCPPSRSICGGTGVHDRR